MYGLQLKHRSASTSGAQENMCTTEASQLHDSNAGSRPLYLYDGKVDWAKPAATCDLGTENAVDRHRSRGVGCTSLLQMASSVRTAVGRVRTYLAVRMHCSWEWPLYAQCLGLSGPPKLTTKRRRLKREVGYTSLVEMACSVRTAEGRVHHNCAIWMHSSLDYAFICTVFRSKWAA